jgi:hypothetical protein
MKGGGTVTRNVGQYVSIALELTSDYIHDALSSRGRQSRRIYQIHVPKTAGTSLENAFLALGGEDPVAVAVRSYHALKQRSGPYTFITNPENSRPFVFRMARYTFGSSHLPAWQLRLRPNTFTITILRDPISRVISLYRYFADDRADEGQAYPSPAMVRLKPGEREWATDGFSRFLDRADKVSLLNQLYMFSSRFDPVEAAARVRTCSLYFFTENFKDGLTALSHHLGLPLVPRADRVSTWDSRPTDNELSRLRDMLDPEYQLLELLRAEPGSGLVGSVPQGGPVA